MVILSTGNFFFRVQPKRYRVYFANVTISTVHVTIERYAPVMVHVIAVSAHAMTAGRDAL